MRSFDEIYAIALERKGEQNLLAGLRYPKPTEELRAIPDDRWLSQATQAIFNSGFNWKVVEAKWSGFEAAFQGFNLEACAYMRDEDFDRLMSDKSIIRNGAKLHSVATNAQFFIELRQEYGNLGTFFALSTPEDYVGLLEHLKSKGARLGGHTGQYFLRFMGVDSFILSMDVVTRLVAEGVVEKEPSSKGAMKKVQDAFNLWRGQSGRSLTEISRVLAMSV